MTDMDDKERSEAVANAVSTAFNSLLAREVAAPESAGLRAADMAFQRALKSEAARDAKRRSRGKK